MHHRGARPWARIPASSGRPGHLAWEVWISLSWSRGIHVHLWISWHAHERTVGRLVRHHLTTHSRHRSVDELATSSKRSMLYVRAHTEGLYRHLLGKPRHALRLVSVHVPRHGARRRVHRGCGMRKLHVVTFEVRGPSLTVVWLRRWVSRGVLRSGSLHAVWCLEMRWQLVLMRHLAIAHDIVRC
jgi:hypothetical protein